MDRYNLKIFNCLFFFIPLIGVSQIVSLNSQLYFMDSSTNELHEGIAVRYSTESIHVYNGEKHIKVEGKTGTAIFSLYTDFFFDGGGNKFPWVYQKGYSDKEKDIFDSPNGDKFIFFHDSKDLWHLTGYISEKDTFKYIRVFNDIQNFVWMDSKESKADKNSDPLSTYFEKPEPLKDDSSIGKNINTVFEDYLQRDKESFQGTENFEIRTLYLGDINADSKQDIVILYTIEGFDGSINWSRNLILIPQGQPHLNQEFDVFLYEQYGNPAEFLGFKDGLAVFKFTDRFDYDSKEYTLKGYGIVDNKLVIKEIKLP